MKKIHNQAGDTIVEVLISIAVLSMILSASYALASRSTQSVRKSQERAEALKYSEQQLERLKHYLRATGAWDNVLHDCLVEDGAMIKATVVPDCKFGDRYQSQIEASDNTYTISTSWEALGGGRDSMSVVYRVYR